MVKSRLVQAPVLALDTAEGHSEKPMSTMYIYGSIIPNVMLYSLVAVGPSDVGVAVKKWKGLSYQQLGCFESLSQQSFVSKDDQDIERMLIYGHDSLFQQSLHLGGGVDRRAGVDLHLILGEREMGDSDSTTKWRFLTDSALYAVPAGMKVNWSNHTYDKNIQGIGDVPRRALTGTPVEHLFRSFLDDSTTFVKRGVVGSLELPLIFFGTARSPIHLYLGTRSSLDTIVEYVRQRAEVVQS